MRITNILIGLFIFTNTAFSQSSAAFWLAGEEQQQQTLPIVTSGLIAYYDASNVDSYDPANPGSTWNDLSGNNYHVTNYGATHSTNYEGVFYFDGVDDYMVYEGAINEDVMTFSIWTKGSNITTNCIIDLDDINLTNNLNQELLFFNGISNDQFAIQSELSGTYELTGNSSYVINENTWYYITFTYNSGTYNLYINNVLISTTTDPSADLGAFDFFFNGYIGELFFYDRVLTSQELTDNYNATKDRYVELCDEYYYNTSLLLHMDGTNGSTTFTDNSINNFTVTANGNTQISTAQSKFGGASGKFDGSGDFIEVANSQEFNMGSGDFTIEGWMYLNTTSSQQSLICFIDRLGAGFGPEVAFALEYNGVNNFRGYVYSGSQIYNVTNATPVITNTWYHLAFVRSGNTLNLFVNGISTGTTTISVALNYNTNFTLNNSYFSSSPRFLNGFLDDIRITKGVARYTSNFTPPAAPFEDNACLWDGTQTSLLDDYPGAAAAYSVRALSSTYTGPLMQVRRTDNGNTYDIYALADGNLDETYIANVCSGTNCTVQTFYDQSGNGNDLSSPAANQPTIYASGSIQTSSGKPAFNFDGSNDYFIRSGLNITQPFSVFMTFEEKSRTSSNTLFDSESPRSSSVVSSSTQQININSGTTVSGGALTIAPHIASYVYNGSNSYLNVDGLNRITNANPGTNGIGNLAIGWNIGGNQLAYANMYFQEFILYPSNQLSNITNIENNINSYYSIY